MTAAEFWIEQETPRRPGWTQLAAGLGIGLLLGIAVTAVASVRIAARAPAIESARAWPHPALDREWRGMRTPVDVERMFPTPR